jgi:Ran GTPase-activating protein (RanGAP) involved in mRNA processing and transport
LNEKTSLSLGGTFSKIFKSPNKVSLLDLSNVSLGPKGVKLLVDTLIETKNTTLKTLALSRTYLKQDGFRAVARLIEQSRVLSSIDISSNKMDEGCVDALAGALARTSTLTHLDVGCCLEKSGATVALLSALNNNRSIKSLSIEHAFYGNDTGKAVSALLAVNTTLTSLNGSHTTHSDVNITAALSSMQPGLQKSATLKELILKHCFLEDPCAFELAEAIKASHSLIKLDLAGEFKNGLGSFIYSNHFSPQGVRALLVALAQNNSIQHFFLSSESTWVSENVHIPDNIGQILSQNHTLRTLDLRGKCAGLEATSTMFNALKTNKTLLSLTLCDLQITADVIPSFIDALMINTTLQELSLARNRLIGSVGATAFAKYLESPNAALNVLDLSACNINDAGAIALADALAKNSSLRSLNLSNSDQIRNPSAQAFAKLLREHQRLQVLDLRHCSIGATGLTAVMSACDSTKSISFVGLTGNLSGALPNPPESVAAFEEDPMPRRFPIDLNHWDNDHFDDDFFN